MINGWSGAEQPELSTKGLNSFDPGVSLVPALFNTRVLREAPAPVLAGPWGRGMHVDV